MLPLIPALLLLLLQGPSNVERLAADGRLPQALDAVQRQSRIPMIGRAEEERILASLLEASQDPQFSQALLALLTVHRPPEKPVAPDAAESRERPILPAQVNVTLPEGMRRGNRSRDGP